MYSICTMNRSQPTELQKINFEIYLFQDRKKKKKKKRKKKMQDKQTQSNNNLKGVEKTSQAENLFEVLFQSPLKQQNIDLPQNM